MGKSLVEAAVLLRLVNLWRPVQRISSKRAIPIRLPDGHPLYHFSQMNAKTQVFVAISLQNLNHSTRVGNIGDQMFHFAKHHYH